MRFWALLFTVLFSFPLFSYSESPKNTELSDYFGGVINLEEKAQEPYPYAYYKAYAKAQKLVENTHYYEALKAYEALGANYGKSIELAIGRAEAYYYLGDYKTSRRFFEEGMQFADFAQHSQWALVHYRMAFIAYHEKNEEEFVSLLRSVIGRDGSNDDSILAIVLDQGLDAAVSYFTLSPSYAYEAYRELGLYFALAGKFEEGLPYVLTALAMAVQWGIRDVLYLHDMSFAFSDLQYFFEKLIESPQGRTFLQETEVGRIMYALKHYFASANTPVHATRMPLSNKRYVQMLLTLLDNNSIVSTADATAQKAYYPVIRR